MMDMNSKPAVRRLLRGRLSAIPQVERHARSALACSWVSAMPEFNQAQVVMLYLNTPEEVRDGTAGPEVLAGRQDGRRPERWRGTSGGCCRLRSPA